MDGCRQTSMYVCMHAWMDIGKTACMYVYPHTYIHAHIQNVIPDNMSFNQRILK